MSGLAEILLTMGCRVTGSDLARSPATDRLKRRGAKIFIGHRSENIGQPQAVVVSSAVSTSNSELKAARHKGIPVISRGEMLAELMRLKYGIAVAGSHGKTTTTSLVAAVLEAGGLDPTVVIGGRVKTLRSNARLGKGNFLVAEADESDGSFLHLNPTVAVVTNIDREHMDHYRNFEELKRTFAEFAAKIPFYGTAIFCADHPLSAGLAKNFPKRFVTYGVCEKADYTAEKIRLKGWESRFGVRCRDDVLGEIRLHLPGMHNVLNSLAAVAVGRELGMKFSDIRRGLAAFRGVGRRMERIYDKKILIVDDYGHHPTEVRATIQALHRAIRRRRMWVVFQPHRYSRTKDLFGDFTKVFDWAVKDEGVRLILTDIYAASEEPIQGVSGRRLFEAVAKGKKKDSVLFVADVADIPGVLAPKLEKGDVVLTLGAGHVWKVGRALAERYERS